MRSFGARRAKAHSSNDAPIMQGKGGEKDCSAMVMDSMELEGGEEEYGILGGRVEGMGKGGGECRRLETLRVARHWVS